METSEHEKHVDEQILELLGGEKEEDEIKEEIPNQRSKQDDELKWYNKKFEHLACQLPASILEDMKERILNSKINRVKLELNGTSEHMESFFIKEIDRYNKKLNKQQEFKAKQQLLDEKEKQYLEKIAACEKTVAELTIELQKKDEDRKKLYQQGISILQKLKEEKGFVEELNKKYEQGIGLCEICNGISSRQRDTFHIQRVDKRQDGKAKIM